MVFNKDIDEKVFLERVVHLTPEGFIGLAHLLNVKMSIVNKETGEYALRDAEEIALECAAVFRKMPHKARKAILKLMRDSYGTATEHTTQD